METSENKTGNDEFYIGWMSKAPSGAIRFLRKYISLVLICIALLGIMLALSQKKFGTGNFEFGTLNEIKGIYFNQPVPLLKVIAGKDIFGNLSYITIPLVGYGKHGADGIIAALEKQKNISLDQKEVTFKGTLLYNDGKTILQIDEHDAPLLRISNGIVSTEVLPTRHSLGMQTVKGEIVDPKCYFGVMKPGEGKPHRDCAIRCILGGMPPMLTVRNSKGEANYYLIVGANGEKMNVQVQDYVAEPIELQAEVVELDDWIVLYVNNKPGIRRIAGLSLVKNIGDVVVCSSLLCSK